MLLAVDSDEDLVDEECIAAAAMSSFQSAGINGTKLDTPKTDCFPTDSDSPLGKEILDIAVAEVESIVEPDSVGDDVRWESVTFICVHPPILPVSVSLLVSTAICAWSGTSEEAKATASNFMLGVASCIVIVSLKYKHDCRDSPKNPHRGT